MFTNIFMKTAVPTLMGFYNNSKTYFMIHASKNGETFYSVNH